MGNPRRNPRKRVLPATRRRALESLASCGHGCTEATLLAHGFFTVEQMPELVRAGLATAITERVVARGRRMEVARADHGRLAARR